MPKTIGADGTGGKRHPLNMRTTAETRERLEAAAKGNGRSLAQEVEARLEQSLSHDEYYRQLWGDDVFAIAESMGRALWHIERENGARWFEDKHSFDDFLGVTEEIIRSYHAMVHRDRSEVPSGALATLKTKDRHRLFAAMGGISPPRPREQPDPDRDAAERDDNIARWKTQIESLSSRPLLAPDIYEKRRRSTDAGKATRTTRRKSSDGGAL